MLEDHATEERIYSLTKCGISRDDARRMIAAPDAKIIEGIAQGEAMVAKLEGERKAWAESILTAMRAEAASRNI